MGKKKKMITKPQKYGRKYAKHPILSTKGDTTEEVKFEPIANPIIEVPEEEAVEVELKTTPKLKKAPTPEIKTTPKLKKA